MTRSDLCVGGSQKPFTHGHGFKADQWRKPAEMAFRKAR
jgi:hypothetical protein